MISFSINLNGDNAWPDLRDKPIIHVKEAMSAAVLEGGMVSGLPSVALRIELPNGETVVAETSARLFCTAAKAIMAKYPKLFEGH